MMNNKTEFRPLSEGLAALKANLPSAVLNTPLSSAKPHTKKTAKQNKSTLSKPANASPLSDLANVELPNFAFGAKTFQKTLQDYRPIILNLARNGIRKPSDVSKSLNAQNLKTACNSVWTDRLTSHLLRMIFETAHKSDAEITKTIDAFVSRASRETKERQSAKKQKVTKSNNLSKVATVKKAKSPEIKPLARPQGLDGKVKKRNPSSPPVSELLKPPLRASSIDVATFVDRALGSLEGKTPVELVKMWRNCVDKLANPNLLKWHADALRLMTAIEEVWSAKPLNKKLSFDDFLWPDTYAVAGRNKGIEIDQGDGMLSYLEYHVGRLNGAPTNVRQIILTRVFENKLPFVFTPEYMAEWGEPHTSQRLRKMAESLASFARNLKRRENELFGDAIKQWEADLSYLYHKYYLSQHHFGWPDTAI